MNNCKTAKSQILCTLQISLSNLVVVNSCNNVPVIKNFMSIICKLTWFLNGSNKHKNIMKYILKTRDHKELDFDMLMMMRIYCFNTNDGVFRHCQKLVGHLALILYLGLSSIMAQL